MRALRSSAVRTVGPAVVAALLVASAARADDPVTAPAGRDDGTELSRLWLERHEALQDRLRRGPVDLLFIGDSITHYWEPSPLWQRHGHDTWERYYGRRNAVNLGVAGDDTGHVSWRLEHTDFSRVSPRLAVVNIGTNNYLVSTPEDTADGIVAVVEQLRRKLPRTRVLLLAIFPRGEKADDPARQFVARSSRLSSRVADGEMVHYLDIGHAFLDDEGTLSADVMPDFLHLNEKGYEIWAKAMEPKVKELMGD